VTRRGCKSEAAAATLGGTLGPKSPAVCLHQNAATVFGRHPQQLQFEGGELRGLPVDGHASRAAIEAQLLRAGHELKRGGHVIDHKNFRQ